VEIRVVETITGKSCMGLESRTRNRQIGRLTEILGSATYHGVHSSLALASARTSRQPVWRLAKSSLLVAGHLTAREIGGDQRR